MTTFETLQRGQRIGFTYTDKDGEVSCRIGPIDNHDKALRRSKAGARLVTILDETSDNAPKSFRYDRMAELSIA